MKKIMGFAINLLVIIIVLLGGIFSSKELTLGEVIFIVSFTAFVAIVVGVWWLCSAVANLTIYIESSLNKDDPLKLLFGGKTKWLQGARPVGVDIVKVDISSKPTLFSYMHKKLFKSYLLAIGLCFLAVLFEVLRDGGSSGAIFGSILDNDFGKAFAVMFLIYAAISSLSFFICGLIAKLRRKL